MNEMRKAAALTTAHKVLIGSAIGLAIVFGAFSANRQDWVMVTASFVMLIALVFYLRWFLNKVRD